MTIKLYNYKLIYPFKMRYKLPDLPPIVKILVIIDFF